MRIPLNVKPEKFFMIAVWVLFYAGIFSFLLYNSYGYLDPDLGWHLKVGQAIISTGAAPDLDLYTYTLEGQHWVDHEWLSNVLMFWIYDRFGYGALNIFFVLLLLLILLLQTWFIKKYLGQKRAGAFFIMSLQLTGVLAMSPHLGVRIQEIALLFLTLLLVIVYQFRRTKNCRVLLWLGPLFFFWSNLHGSFLIGLFILCLYAAYAVTAWWKRKSWPFSAVDESRLSGQRIIALNAFIGLAILATLATPYGLKLYAFLGDYANAYYMKHIAEWLPAYYWPIQYKQLIYSALVAAASFFAIGTAIFAWRKKTGLTFDPWLLLLSWLFLFLSFKSKRHFPLFYVISFPLLLSLAPQIIQFPAVWRKRMRGLFVQVYLAAGFILVALFFLVSARYPDDPFADELFCRYYPCAAVAYLKSRPAYQEYRLFNRYNWGGFLVWAWPEKKLFIDGRLPQYKYRGQTFLEEYFDFFDEDKAAQKLSEHDIGLVMLATPNYYSLNWFDKHVLGLDEKKLNDQPDHLKNFVASSPDWRQAYEDETAIIYEKIKE